MTEATEPKEDKLAELLTAQAERQNDLLATLIAQNQKPEAAKAKAEEPTYTQAQLQEAVDAGKISVGDMVTYLVNQGTKKAAAELREQFKGELATERTRGTVETKLAAYKASLPELGNKNSAEFKLAAAKFAELVDEGHDRNDLRTELMALRYAFPDGDKPKAPARETTSTRQRSVEATGSRGGSEKKAAPSSGWPSWMSEKQAEWYDKGIKRGLYKDRNDPELKKELVIAERKAKERAA